MTHSDEEIRYMAIGLLKQRTARDEQRRIGASNVSNGCDYCLACNFLGDDRATPITDQAWMGRVLGTAFHGLLESRIPHSTDSLLRNAHGERHVVIGNIPGYGEWGGTIDLEFDDQIGDWKGATRKKICLLIDYLAGVNGDSAPYGRTHKDIKLSEREYAAEMTKMEFKVQGYYGQQTLYMRGSGKRRASLIFIARDGTGMFDNPSAARYDDPKAVHDVFVLSFDYDEAYSDALIARAEAIWAYLESGGLPGDFQRNERCFACEQDTKESARPIPQNVDIEVAYNPSA